MILITGATGHVGNTLVHDLAKKGYDLRLFLQPNEAVGALDGLKFDLVCGDIRDPEAVDRAVAGCDHVFHLAGLIDISPKDAKLLEEINVDGTRNIVRSCLKYKVQRLVYISSVHAIPEPPKGTAIREPGRSAFPDKSLKGAYAISKSKATAAIYEGIDQGLDAVMLFPSGIIGPGDYRGSQMGKVIRYLLGKNRSKTLPCFQGSYNFVDVRDVSYALQAAMEKGHPGEGYIISGHTMTIPQLFRHVAKWMGKTKVKLVMFPGWLVMAAARVVQRFAHLFNRKPFFTPYSLEVLDSNSEMDASKAETDLGFKARPLEETLDETASWLTRHTPLLQKFKKRHEQRKEKKATSTRKNKHLRGLGTHTHA